MPAYDPSAYEVPLAVAGAAAALIVEQFVSQGDPEQDAQRIRETMFLIRPEAEDYERVFVGEAIPVARAYYESAWAANPTLPAVPMGAEPDIWGVAAAAFSADVRHWPKFSGGMGRVGRWLNPDRIWLGWRLRTGPTESFRAEGLVWLDGRFALFPKVWGALGALS